MSPETPEGQGQTEPAASSLPQSATDATADRAAAAPQLPDAAVRPAGADPRPRPRFGEYAPLEEAAPDASAAGAAAGGGTAPGLSAASAAAPAFGEQATAWNAQRPDSPSPERGAGGSGQSMPGVPHNLGVGGHSGGQRTGRPFSGATPPPYRPNEHTPGQGDAYRAPGPLSAPPAPGRGRTGDRVVTILLLVIGAFGALISAGLFQQLRSTLVIYTEALGLTDAQIPNWVGTTGTVSALAVLALYAVTLISSIRRMRAGKLAFFIPLIAGVIVMIATIVILNLSVAAVPGLLEEFMKPDALDRILSYVGGISTP